MLSVLISGAGSGIGHEFLEQFAKNSANRIWAVDVSWAEEVDNRDYAARVTKLTIDTTSSASVDELLNEIKDEPIDLFIHSAAVRGLVKSKTKESDNPSDAETMGVMDRDTMMTCLTVNVVGSFMLIRALIPNLKAAKNGRCVIMGSRMGSIASNDGGAYAYRASKAALNQLVKSFSIDVPEIIFTIIHPGRVESRMTHVREDGAVNADDAIAEMLPKIEAFTMKDSGKFYTREGNEIPW